MTHPLPPLSTHDLPCHSFLLSFTLSLRVVISPKVLPEDLPPLPRIIDDELRRRVFTHRSFYARPTHIFEDPDDDPSPDNEM